MSHPDWPKDIERDGPYKVYKGNRYTVYDDGNSADTPFQTDLAEAALSRLRAAVAALKVVESTDGVFCVVAQRALEEIGDLPGD